MPDSEDSSDIIKNKNLTTDHVTHWLAFLDITLIIIII